MDRDRQGHELTAAWPVERREERISGALARDRQLTPLDLLACVGCAALLLDESGTITGANALAERLLGSDLDVRACQLVASNRASNDLLQDLLRTALKRMPRSYSVLLPPVL